MRVAEGRSHALSAVYGSSTTNTRWNVVSHWSREASGPASVCRGRSPGASVTMAPGRVTRAAARSGDGGAAPAADRRYSSAVHPIERLRYVARAGGVDSGELVREAAGALGGLGDDEAGLVLSCKRLVDRQPASGPLWWLCARMLRAGDPRAEAWRCVAEIDADPTARGLADELPDEARVAVLGWPELVAEALPR